MNGLTAVDQVIAARKYSGNILPIKRRTGLDDTLGQDPIDFGRKTGFDYMLFVHGED